MDNGIRFTYIRLESPEDVRTQIKQCEGKHVQQCAFSTFMDTLTQICFTEQVIRSTIEWEGNRSWVRPIIAGNFVRTDKRFIGGDQE